MNAHQQSGSDDALITHLNQAQTAALETILAGVEDARELILIIIEDELEGPKNRKEQAREILDLICSTCSDQIRDLLAQTHKLRGNPRNRPHKMPRHNSFSQN